MWRIAHLLLLALPGAVVIWAGLNLPPPLWLIEYGLAPGCEPTGRTWAVEGVEFVEIGRGISRMGSDALARDPDRWDASDADAGGGVFAVPTAVDLVGRVASRIGVGWGRTPVPSDEMPVHWVEFPHGFAIARTEVTWGQFRRMTGENGAEDPRLPADEYAVTDVDFEQATRYCAWLARASGWPVRLPTEAEWEAACRAGARTEFWCGDDPVEALRHIECEPMRTRVRDDGTEVTELALGTGPAALRKPNPWGLRGMAGGVEEWCRDGWHDGYEGAPTDGSAWTEVPPALWWLFSGVVRGGDWDGPAVGCRSAARSIRSRNREAGEIGIRPAFTPPDR